MDADGFCGQRGAAAGIGRLSRYPRHLVKGSWRGRTAPWGQACGLSCRAATRGALVVARRQDYTNRCTCRQLGCGGVPVLSPRRRGSRTAGWKAPCRRAVSWSFLDRRTSWDWKKVTGTFCANHPEGFSGKRCLSPFSSTAGGVCNADPTAGEVQSALQTPPTGENRPPANSRRPSFRMTK